MNKVNDSNNNSKANTKQKVSLTQEDIIFAQLKENLIPAYLLHSYRKYYLDEKTVEKVDNNFIASISSFFHASKLENWYLSEIKPTDSVLNVGNIYGSLIPKIATKLTEGNLDIIDVVPLQIDKLIHKLQGFNNVDLWVQDARTPLHREYDTIGFYFLLHEVPDVNKTQIINSALSNIDDFDSKVVFIDFHYPHNFNIFRGIFSLANAFLEPYAGSLWDKEIKHFTNKYHKYNWKKELMFGGVFQKVTVTSKHKTTENEKLTKETNNLRDGASKTTEDTHPEITTDIDKS